MRRRLSVLLATVMMLAMMMVSAGMASAVVLSNGKGGEKANDRAVQGIYTAIANTTKHDGCSFACE
jgi:hypothetical protein